MADVILPAEAEAGAGRRLSRWEWLAAAAGAAALAATAAGCAAIPATLRGVGRIGADQLYKQALLRLDLLLAGVAVAALLLTPAAAEAVRRVRRRWKNWHTVATLAVVCGFLTWFVVHFGRWQFGAFDFNIVIDMGWRQILGQRPYIDFPATTPPGFNLGIKYADQLFGVSWNANLYFSALFACLTFLWMYWLMVRLSMGRLAAAAVAFAIECAAMLTLCFWWYNDSVLVLAAVFFLSCIFYARQERAAAAQVSYVAALALLSLMKPNVAGLAIAGGVVLLLVVAERRMRLVLLTLAAAAAAVGFLLLNHVSVPAMLQSYLSVARGRGGVSARFGYREMTRFEKHSALLWIAIVSLPLLGLVPRLWSQMQRRDWKGIAFGLLFPLALLVALYGLATNGEWRDAECTMLLAAGGVLTFGQQKNGVLLRRAFIAILCASMAGDLYYGAERIRVYGIGVHQFFEWRESEHRVDSGFLKDMRVSPKMAEVETDIQRAIDSNPGPFFFGQRVDFNYAVFGLESPRHFPAWWHPGTAFGLAEQPEILDAWQKDRFPTLIFLRLDWDPDGFDHTYYPQEWMDMIKNEYEPEGDYATIKVFRRRPDVQ